MNTNLYIRIIHDIAIHHYNIDEITSKFYCESIKDVMDYITNTFVESVDEFVENSSFIVDYHEALFKLADAIDKKEDIDYLKMCLERHLNKVKCSIKPYNKKLKEKDYLLTLYTKLKYELLGNYNYVINIIETTYENDVMSYIKFIINNLKDIDALYYLISNKPELINTKSLLNRSLLETITRDYLYNINSLSREDSIYYQRIITMFVFNNNLIINEDEIDNLIDDINYLKGKVSKDKKEDLIYIQRLLESLVNVIAYTPNIIYKNNRTNNRNDFRRLKTFTIDSVKMIGSKNMIFDDAFSIETKDDGTYYLYIHVPDVDEYIELTTDVDKLLKEKCESIYKRGNNDPLIPFDLANKMSLKENNDRCAITYRIHVDSYGNVLGIKFFKSLINIDYNLSLTKADALMKSKFVDNELLYTMSNIAKKIRNKRNMIIGKRSRAGLIMDEFTILANMSTASHFLNNGLPFPYKNLEKENGFKHIELINNYIMSHEVNDEIKKDLFSIIKVPGRTLYSPICTGNSKFNMAPYGVVTNPLREYISLEINRLVKDLLIDEKENYSYWEDRIEKDCIEITERSAIVKELYKRI